MYKMYTRNTKDCATTPRAARCHYLYILFAHPISKISSCSFLVFAYLFLSACLVLYFLVLVFPYDVNITIRECELREWKRVLASSITFIIGANIFSTFKILLHNDKLNCIFLDIICFICALSICILLIWEESYLIWSLCIAFASSPVPGIMELSRSMNGWISSAERSISNHCTKSSSSLSSSSITGLA